MSTESAASICTTTVSSKGHNNLSSYALLIGIIGLGISGFGLFRGLSESDPRPLLSWLIGFSFWFSILMGTLYFIMFFYLFDSGWSVIIRRQLEHAVAGLKWLALVFSPLLFISIFHDQNPGILWEWLNQEKILAGSTGTEVDVLYLSKSSYLSANFFFFRAVIFFLIWIGLAEVFRWSSFSMDQDGDIKHVRRCRIFSAVGVILTSLTLTFASIDWLKSLEYHWFSTMYGVWFFASSILSSLAATVIACYLLRAQGRLKGILTNAHFYYLGCLMLAFTVFWAYISFSQYFLVYNANIPEETFWYNIREINPDGGKNSWWWVSLGLIFCHFFFPFLWLLWYKNKFGLRIVFISVWILIVHLLDLYWNILPGKIHLDGGYAIQQFGISFWDISMVIGAGGICVWSYLKSLNKAQIIPVRDPRILESINAHE